MATFAATWSTKQRLCEALLRSKTYLPTELGRQVDALVRPENLEIFVATTAIWAGAHFFGVGEIVDIALPLVGAFFVGWSAEDVAGKLLVFARKSSNARSDVDLDQAARAFAEATMTAGMTAVMALLLRKSAIDLQAARGASVLDVMRQARRPGLATVGSDAQASVAWRKPSVKGDPALPAGAGETNAFGDVVYSTKGGATEQQLVRVHELVHSFFSPRMRFLRTFRARLAMSAYSRSAVLRYLEEGLAESVAQVSAYGISGLIRGVRFPVTNGYMTLSELGTEGAAIGTIMIGDQRVTVRFFPDKPCAAGLL